MPKTSTKKAAKTTKPEVTNQVGAMAAAAEDHAAATDDTAKATKKRGGKKAKKPAAKDDATPAETEVFTTETWPGNVFSAGEYYETARGELYYCNGSRKVDGVVEAQMTPAPDGEPTNAPPEWMNGMSFARYLEPAAVVEHREACRHEREAEEETARRAAGLGEDPNTTPAPDGEPTKAPRAPRKPREPKAPGKMSCLDAAAQVLRDAGQPLGAKEMIDRMAAAGLWTSPGGATPHSTLYAAIIREISKKGADARFAKTDRGLFTTAGNATPTPTNAATATDEATPTETPAAE